MKTNRIGKAIGMILLCLALMSPITLLLPQLSAVALPISERILFRQSIEKISHAFESAKAINDKLHEFVLEEINTYGDTDGEFEIQVAEEKLREIAEDLALLDTLLLSLEDLDGDMETSVGKTVLAVREYLNTLRNISLDMSELIEYSIELYRAIVVIGDVNENAQSYSQFADEIYTATSTGIAMLENLTPPAYLKITHDDLILRIKELNDFSVDFYIAAELDDPLRLYSCFYRMNRVEAQMNRCAENLDEDLLLQFEQAYRRLSGHIALLRGELTKNIDLLLAV